ncbi:MAG: nucleotidyltransferase family protein [Candidatus Omnitrophota bacterium]
MISCVLLSAGFSARFGSPKALATFSHETVIGRLQRLLIDSAVDEAIIVLGHDADQIKPHLLEHGKIKVVYNKDYKLGQTSSFKTGLRTTSPHAQGIMLFPVDLPVVKIETVNFLIDQFHKEKPAILIPTYNGKKGHPPIFHSRLKADFLTLDDSAGLNTLQHQFTSETFLTAVHDPGILLSFNTPEELQKIEASL